MIFKNNNLNLNAKQKNDTIIFTDTNYSNFKLNSMIELEEYENEIMVRSSWDFGKNSFKKLDFTKVKKIYFISRNVNDFKGTVKFTYLDKSLNVELNTIYIENKLHNYIFIKNLFDNFYNAKTIAQYDINNYISMYGKNKHYSIELKKAIDNIPSSFININAFFDLINEADKKYKDNIELFKYFYKKYKNKIDSAFKKIVSEYKYLLEKKEYIDEDVLNNYVQKIKEDFGIDLSNLIINENKEKIIDEFNIYMSKDNEYMSINDKNIKKLITKNEYPKTINIILTNEYSSTYYNIDTNIFNKIFKECEILNIKDEREAYSPNNELKTISLPMIFTTRDLKIKEINLIRINKKDKETIKLEITSIIYFEKMKEAFKNLNKVTVNNYVLDNTIISNSSYIKDVELNNCYLYIDLEDLKRFKKIDRLKYKFIYKNVDLGLPLYRKLRPLIKSYNLKDTDFIDKRQYYMTLFLG